MYPWAPAARSFRGRVRGGTRPRGPRLGLERGAYCYGRPEGVRPRGSTTASWLRKYGPTTARTILVLVPGSPSGQATCSSLASALVQLRVRPRGLDDRPSLERLRRHVRVRTEQPQGRVRLLHDSRPDPGTSVLARPGLTGPVRAQMGLRVEAQDVHRIVVAARAGGPAGRARRARDGSILRSRLRGLGLLPAAQATRISPASCSSTGARSGPGKAPCRERAAVNDRRAGESPARSARPPDAVCIRRHTARLPALDRGVAPELALPVRARRPERAVSRSSRLSPRS